MAFKLLIVAAAVIVANSTPLPDQPGNILDPDQHLEPKYSYAYTVQDERTGDHKSQHESRQGDRVQGQYRLRESDGTERIVDYTANDKDGFRAVVRHEPERHQHPVQTVQYVQFVPKFDRVERDMAAGSNSHLVYVHPWAYLNSVRHN
ncbi:larval cuticle protein A2B-like [Topomyia yanbarensis]|uniref:larval cuticle protein A2B-like n=1 Tax=Topomyia yanbarensis TaxID=2498891 RepID=UPI00273CDD6C|nr:larval cuticle protein A2B-like [Topomyia yanbarensis]